MSYRQMEGLPVARDACCVSPVVLDEPSGRTESSGLPNAIRGDTCMLRLLTGNNIHLLELLHHQANYSVNGFVRRTRIESVAHAGPNQHSIWRNSRIEV